MPSRAASASMASWLRAKVKLVSVMVVTKCLSTLYFPLTLPIALPISAAPDRVPRSTRPVIRASSVAVAWSRSARLRARSAARAGLRQAMSVVGVVGVGDLGQVLGVEVEQAHLQRPVITGEFGDRWCP